MTLLHGIAQAPKPVTFDALKNELSKKYGKHLVFTDADKCIKSMYKDRLGEHKKSGKRLFEFFKKMIYRKDALKNEAVRKLCQAAHKTLNNSKKLSSGPKKGLVQANKHYDALLQKEVQKAAPKVVKAEAPKEEAPRPVVVKERREAIFDELKAIFPRDIDKLAFDYMEVSPQVQQEIETALRNAQGKIDTALDERLQSLGRRFGDAFESLDLHDVPLDNLKLIILASVFPNVKKLNVSNCSLDADCVSTLGHFSKLETLEMNGNPNIAFNGLRSTYQFTALRELSMNNCNLVHSALSQIPSGIFANVERLAVRSNQFQYPAAPCRIIANRFPNLRHLDIGDNNMYLYGISQCVHLESLCFSNSPAYFYEFPQHSKSFSLAATESSWIPTLRQLDLRGSPVNEDTKKYMRKQYPGVTIL